MSTYGKHFGMCVCVHGQEGKRMYIPLMTPNS